MPTLPVVGIKPQQAVHVHVQSS